MFICDSHAHWLPEEIINNAHFFHKGWSDVQAHVRMMQAVGIAKTVLTYPTTDAYSKLGGHAAVARIYNDNVAEIVRRYPRNFIGAAILPGGDSARMMDELKRATQELGFKAISMASNYDNVYLDDKGFLPVYKEAARNNIPIFVHPQIVKPIGSERVQDPLLTPVIEYIFDTTICIGKLLTADVLREYADVKFIFAHFGGVTPFLVQRFDDTYRMLRSMNFVKDLKGDPREYLKNIYMDTSGDKTKANFLAALELVGPKHILWGSDWPAKTDPTASIQAVRDLDISEQDKEDILGGNFERILGH